MDSGQRNQSGAGGRNPLPGSEFLSTPLGGTMDAPPMPVADTFAEEMAVGSTPGRDATMTSPQDGPSDATSQAKSVASDAASKAKDVASDASGKATDLAADAKSAVQDAVSDPAGAAQDVAAKAKSAADSVTSAAPETLARVKEWVAAHPMVAVGAGLIGGIVLGGTGGGGGQHHHHHYHGDSGSDQHGAGADSQAGKASGGHEASSGQQSPGGLLGIIQQTGLLAAVTNAADQLMKSANGHAAEIVRQRIPGFDDQLRQKTGSIPPAVPASTTPNRAAGPAVQATRTTPIR